MRWWCSAVDTRWEWVWRPYIGVWLFVGLLLGAYFTAVHRMGSDNPGSLADLRRRRIVSFVAGVALIWATTDWPLGPLGSGYLLSIHTVQYLVFTLAAAPLLIYGTPRPVLRGLIAPAWARSLATFFSKPLVAFAWFNLVLLATHLPAAVEALTVTQLGMFTVDMLWLSSGLVFWWQVLGPLPELPRLSYAGRLAFVLSNIFIPTVPAAFLTFADYPIYGLYELAPRVGGITAIADQQVAGLLMKFVGGMTMFATGTVLFFKWYGAHERGAAADTVALPHD